MNVSFVNTEPTVNFYVNQDEICIQFADIDYKQSFLLNFLQSHLEHCIVHDKLDSSPQLLNEQGDAIPQRTIDGCITQ